MFLTFDPDLFHSGMSLCQTTHRGLSVKQEAPASSVPPTTNPESSDGEDWAGDPEDGEEEGMDGEAGEQGPDEAPSSPEAGLGPSAQSASLEWTCAQCGAHCAEREDYVSHMRKEHGKVCGCSPGGLRQVHGAIS